MNSSSDPLLVAIVGPTGSGKTALSLALAQQFGGEIVNCDSAALYREFDIGTAKPLPEERALVPHHLLDIAEPTQTFTAGDYAVAARRVLCEIAARGGLPIVVGGSGLYLRALFEGLFAGPKRSGAMRERLRKIAGRKGSAHLHCILVRLDPAAAGNIHPHDEPKLIRAIEVCIISRQKMSELWQRGREPLRGFRILRIGLNPERAALYARLNDRARRMFDFGLVEEAGRLLERYGGAAPLLQSPGYKESVALIQGKVDRESAISAAQQAHRNYAKRQMTWFRREPEVEWLEGFGDDPQIQARAALRVKEVLERAG